MDTLSVLGVSSTIDVQIPDPSHLVGEHQQQYAALFEECGTVRKKDEEGRTRLSRRRVCELGLTYPVLTILTKQGFIRWCMCGDAGIDVSIVERAGGTC